MLVCREPAYLRRVPTRSRQVGFLRRPSDVDEVLSLGHANPITEHTAFEPCACFNHRTDPEDGIDDGRMVFHLRVVNQQRRVNVVALRD